MGSDDEVEAVQLAKEIIRTEKEWLIRAVRSCSRVVTGRDSGQVWHKNHKPMWWLDEKLGKWKNPTTNPKDAKNALITKFRALSQNLKEKGIFPEELLEEERLWEKGDINELCALATSSVLLSKIRQVSKIVDYLYDRLPSNKSNQIKSVKTNLLDAQNALLSITSAEPAEHCQNNTRKRSCPGDTMTTSKVRKVEHLVIHDLKYVMPGLSLPAPPMVTSELIKASLDIVTGKTLPKVENSRTSCLFLKEESKKTDCNYQSNNNELTSPNINDKSLKSPEQNMCQFMTIVDTAETSKALQTSTNFSNSSEFWMASTSFHGIIDTVAKSDSPPHDIFEGCISSPLSEDQSRMYAEDGTFNLLKYVDSEDDTQDNIIDSHLPSIL